LFFAQDLKREDISSISNSQSNNISESQLNDIITEIKNIGIKNIIIKNSTKNMYKSKIEYNKYDLYYTYFKWCCTK
jgi:ABC-type Zn uptake system ZnuABC Zn-binding protein ZnuA